MTSSTKIAITLLVPLSAFIFLGTAVGGSSIALAIVGAPLLVLGLVVAFVPSSRKPVKAASKDLYEWWKGIGTTPTTKGRKK